MHRADPAPPSQSPQAGGKRHTTTGEVLSDTEQVGRKIISTQHSSLSSNTDWPYFLIKGAGWMKVPLNINIPQLYESLCS